MLIEMNSPMCNSTCVIIYVGCVSTLVGGPYRVDTEYGWGGIELGNEARAVQNVVKVLAYIYSIRVYTCF